MPVKTSCSVCDVPSLGFGLESAFSNRTTTYFTTRPVPAELSAARLLIRDVTAGVDQQVASTVRRAVVTLFYVS